MAAAEVILISKQTTDEIHERAMSAASDLKSKYVELFEALLVVESRQIYYQFDVPSLQVYCLELLGLSRPVANDLINVVRKSLEVPALADAIRAGLSIYKARKICSVITNENHDEWIELANHSSCRIVERAVAIANPREAVMESLKYVSGDRIEFKLGVDESWAELLTRTKDILSQKQRRNVPSEEALHILMSEFCRKNDPVEKAKRHQGRKDKQSKKTATQPESIRAQPSRYRPAAVEHAVSLRDRNQCKFVDANGVRCEQRRWLAKHHIVEFSRGGEHTTENLITLCWGHHKIEHIKSSRMEVVT